ncbi:MAG TPA: NAD-dependent epimerase/dehydratase family protein, partial [Thermoleophilaceae bacterium]|nr:NAD-dependent epimerase/dehydratase family protein [Thermoleophilaceae bacterium]
MSADQAAGGFSAATGRAGVLTGAAPPASRRVLITGLSTFWGGLLAQALEQDPAIECVIGVDSRDPTRELERTEFVRVSTQHSLLRRVVMAAEIDTVVDTRLTVDSTTASPREAHENNVIGTMNILAACGAADSPVRKFVSKSSAHYYGTAQDDPAFFTEEMSRPHAPATPIERDIVEAEAAVADFAEKRPEVGVTLLRFANVIGAEVRTAHTRLLALPVVPMILGFDPRYQFVHEDDVVGALSYAVDNQIPGIYNVAGDGVLALSEVAGLLGKTYLPLLPPWGTGVAAAAARRLGLNIPPEMLGQLRFGRGLDNRKLKAAGFRYRYTSRESVIALGEHLRLHPLLREVQEPYRYEREVEEFLRWSPNVRDASSRREGALSPQQVGELERALARGPANAAGAG